MDKIKITHQDPQPILRNILNLACVAAMNGYLPSAADISEAEHTGLYWYRQGKVVHLFGRTNNHWAYITEAEGVIEVEFDYRYGRKHNRAWAKAICDLAVACFPDYVAHVVDTVG